jgi:hypothetical protein
LCRHRTRRASGRQHTTAWKRRLMLRRG